MNKKPEVERRTRWSCPKEVDARILGGPNLPKPLHGCAPRVYMGVTAWNKLRKRVYYEANYKCQICGADCSEPGSMDAHELYTINYVDGSSIYATTVGICKKCHNFYHSGRLFTLCRNNNPMYPQKKVLEIVEHGFKLINEWNKNNPDKQKLKAYWAISNQVSEKEIGKKLQKLIDKYDIEFWGEDISKQCAWREWKLIYGTAEYPTPYNSYEAWEKAMKERSEQDVQRKAIENPFSGGPFDKVKEFLEE